MNSTKQKLLNTGAWLIREQGYNHTGIQEILKESGVPKGSFYFYFDNKEEFGLEMIEVYLAFFREKMDAILSDQTIPGLERIRNFLHFFSKMFADEKFVGGCPIGNLALELGDINDRFCGRLSESLRAMDAYFENCIRDAQQKGEVSVHIDAPETAQFIINCWEGAIVRMKVVKSVKPFELLEKMLFTHVLNKS